MVHKKKGIDLQNYLTPLQYLIGGRGVKYLKDQNPLRITASIFGRYLGSTFRENKVSCRFISAGGIFVHASFKNQVTMHVIKTTFVNNRATARILMASAGGGMIFVSEESKINLRIEDTTFESNTARSPNAFGGMGFASGKLSYQLDKPVVWHYL